jgi:3-oxoacyl-[acyl-carrier protein] reductase
MAGGRLQDQVVIVTGGAHGIGSAYCERLAQEEAQVVIADIDGAGADMLAAELRDREYEALAIQVDVTDPEAVARMASTAFEHYGRIDALVNNAAMFQRPAVSRVPFDEIALDEWDQVMAVNVRGVFLCCRAAVGYMKQRGRGKIVNISSSTVHMGTPNFAHYVTSKAAVVGLTRVLARELGQYGINVNAVAPGLTLSLDDLPEDRLQRYQVSAESRSLKRVEKPQDLVGTIVFLCSRDADFVTGQTLVVDGGIAFS